MSESSLSSTEVPFPEAKLEFLDGLEILLYPDLAMPYSVMGVHYILEMRSNDQAARIEITFGSRRRSYDNRPGSHPGPDMVRYIDITPRMGKPLRVLGDDYGFVLETHHPSFVPQDNHYKINNLTPGGGFSIELDSYYLNHLRLFFEPLAEKPDELVP